MFDLGSFYPSGNLLELDLSKDTPIFVLGIILNKIRLLT